MEKKLFDRLIQGLEEMVAIEKGEIEVPPHRIHIHKIPNVKAIRTLHQMKQAEFASLLGVSQNLVQSWEIGRRTPNGAARKLLAIIEQQPNLVPVLQNL
ncbi:NadS family protein [Glaesserella parasuis]|uniref:NadS family protein n=1 Tax=Glaesserella parasuis TaxID=738 RepID=UPI0003ABEAE0|nr:NadS family protein [Glaesserella parasuis]EQA14198.1 helix-turn-helix family protein [Glaesserella parasuis H465]MDG6264158.1 NadS family protein [Glaesserella parasuis]MDG6280889.1 NadS family protein [Glaesserella parasuis]MDG6287232.1 NadS family protein [Glaesserella parasuis]MDG6289369.1 NadS family protein [Glaesserella parasuis]